MSHHHPTPGLPSGAWIGRASILLAVGVVLSWPTACVSAADVHVAVTGDDTRDGSAAAPVASLRRALDRVREIRVATPDRATPIVIEVADGRHELVEPLMILPEDSGTEMSPTVIRAAEGARPVVSGGRVIIGWQVTEVDGRQAVTGEHHRGSARGADDLDRAAAGPRHGLKAGPDASKKILVQRGWETDRRAVQCPELFTAGLHSGICLCPDRSAASPPTGGTTPRSTPRSSATPRRSRSRISSPSRGPASASSSTTHSWQAEKVSIWQAGVHDNPLGQRLTALMISQGLADSAVPMSLLADHPHVQFNYFRGGLGSCAVEMH